MAAIELIRFASSLAHVEAAVERVIGEVSTLPWEALDLDFIKLALIEALVNAVVHGNRENPEKEVTLRYAVGEDHFWVEISDQGDGFDPRKAASDPLSEAFDPLSETGRGLLLIRAAMDEVPFNEKGNTIRLAKYLRRE
ncbi:ATP-binding protein [Heliomicrobium modesticaldum]|uniref:ATP-binding protein n=1 Tax=Heliomicrobium modesticaldum TaxID=35701 RepID=UPI001A9A5BC9|nr:ATP-binding protein [Heliomicrobium modesticaldum]